MMKVGGLILIRVTLLTQLEKLAPSEVGKRNMASMKLATSHSSVPVS